MYKYRKILKNHIIRFIFFASILYIYLASGISCPFYYFFGFYCPTCGVTRALISLLIGDFQKYCNYNIFAIFLVITVILTFHIKFIKNNKVKILIYTLIISVLLLNLIYYLIRLKIGFNF